MILDRRFEFVRVAQHRLYVTKGYHLVFSPIDHGLGGTNDIANLPAVQRACVGYHRKHQIILVAQIVMPLGHVHFDDGQSLRLIEVKEHHS